MQKDCGDWDDSEQQEFLRTSISESGKILFQFDVKAPDIVSLSRGEFHTMKGHLFHVSPTGWKLEKQQKSGLMHDAKGGAVSIG